MCPGRCCQLPCGHCAVRRAARARRASHSGGHWSFESVPTLASIICTSLIMSAAVLLSRSCPLYITPMFLPQDLIRRLCPGQRCDRRVNITLDIQLLAGVLYKSVSACPDMEVMLFRHLALSYNQDLYISNPLTLAISYHHYKKLLCIVTLTVGGL